MKIIVTAIERNRVAEFSQVESEFTELEKICSQVRSTLEIGSLYGGSAKRLAEAMPKGSKMVCVDLGYEALKPTWRTLPTLIWRLESVEDRDITLILGDSSSQHVKDWAGDLGPFDLVFIDGGHQYEQVKSDWETYGPLGSIVAFHDIASCVGAKTLWGEIKGAYRHQEFIDGVSAGIGVLWR